MAQFEELLNQDAAYWAESLEEAKAEATRFEEGITTMMNRFTEEMQ